MSTLMPIGFRRALGVVLVVVLALAGVGRAAATTMRTVDAGDAIPGAEVPICYAARGEAPSGPAVPVEHDCCDACVLLASAVLPAPLALDGPAPVGPVADPVDVVVTVPAIAHRHSPRQSQGPPAA